MRQAPARRHRSPLVLVALGAMLVGCGAMDAEQPEAGELVVLAAASLSDALEELATEFAASGGARVVLDLAGSQTLATRIVEGAPADLFISADAAQLDVVAAAGLVVGEPTTVATNVLVIAVEEGDPEDVTGLADLARDDLVVVLAAEEVPAGRYAAEVLARAGVTVRPASLERSVRAALAKVVQGEADAALVYASDVAAVRRSGARVTGVTIPVEDNVVATYPMAVIRGGGAPAAAAAFAELLRSERGREVLVSHGFGAP